jgi:hypothetical protein
MYLLPLLAVALALQLGRSRTRVVLAFVVTAAMPVFGWLQFNKAMTGHFGMGTLVGYSLSNISGGMIEHVPEEYAVERDVYLKHRAVAMANGGDWECTIFLAADDLKRATGLDDLGLSEQLTKMSLELFRRYPRAYLANFARQVRQFWTSPTVWKLELVRNRSAATWLRLAWKLERPILVGLNGLFLVIGAVLAWRIVRRSLAWTHLERTLVVGALVVLGSCAMQAMLERGTSGRYAIPTQPVVIAICLLTLDAVLRARSKRGMA